MLSRIAESLFWIGRYTERADGTARILDVHLQLLLEDPWVDEATACRSLLSVMGAAGAEPGRELGRADLLRIMTVDRSQPSSIAHSVRAARENARRAREIVSTELWECLNTTHGSMPFGIRQEQAHELFQWVRKRTALAAGIIDSTFSRDDAYMFLIMGRMLERADMTARLLATRSLTEASGASWTTILRSCGAYEAYLRTYRGMPSAANAAEFLLLDRLFPRSILSSVSTALACLYDLQPRHERQGRAGVTDQAQRLLGQIRSDLEYRPMPDTLAELPSYMEAVQAAVSAASEAIRRRYFPEITAPSWVGEHA
ncbi:MAG: alpha-E domain-containing protein [Pseudoclavibacter sp.]|nr:alpha-E domain-containing protein [Pseudoclavibacter sp.]